MTQNTHNNKNAQNPKPSTLRVNKVPEKFQFLIPYAEKWGIIDAVVRDRVVNDATDDELEELVSQVCPYDEALDEWLAGPEATQHPPSIEYVVFSCMRLAADMASLIRDKRRSRDAAD